MLKHKDIKYKLHNRMSNVNKIIQVYITYYGGHIEKSRPF